MKNKVYIGDTEIYFRNLDDELKDDLIIQLASERDFFKSQTEEIKKSNHFSLWIARALDVRPIASLDSLVHRCPIDIIRLIEASNKLKPDN